MLSLHISLSPKGQIRVIVLNIDKIKRQVLIKHKFVLFWYMF